MKRNKLTLHLSEYSKQKKISNAMNQFQELIIIMVIKSSNIKNDLIP